MACFPAVVIMAAPYKVCTSQADEVPPQFVAKCHIPLALIVCIIEVDGNTIACGRCGVMEIVPDSTNTVTCPYRSANLITNFCH